VTGAEGGPEVWEMLGLLRRCLDLAMALVTGRVCQDHEGRMCDLNSHICSAHEFSKLGSDVEGPWVKGPMNLYLICKLSET
jgi:hypothetical protein